MGTNLNGATVVEQWEVTQGVGGGAKKVGSRGLKQAAARAGAEGNRSKAEWAGGILRRWECRSRLLHKHGHKHCAHKHAHLHAYIHGVHTVKPCPHGLLYTTLHLHSHIPTLGINVPTTISSNSLYQKVHL